MSEAPQSERKKSKGARRLTAAAPLDGGALTAWRTWGVIGVALVGGVVAWKLLGSTYKADVETICNAENGSGITIQKDMSKVTQWVRGHLATPEGNELYSTLSDSKLVDRAKRLQSEAGSLKVSACPMVQSYERLAAEGEYRADLQHLCSSVTFPSFAELDDAQRLAKLEDWIDKQAKSPRTKELSDPLRQAVASDRAKVLRDAANKMDVFSCETAKTLESPQATPKSGGPAMVRPYAAPQIIGGLKPEDLAKALADVTPAMTDCYKKGLDKTPDLAGKLSVKMQIDPDGKVTKSGVADSTVTDRDVIGCILLAMKGMRVSATGPLASVMVPLELSTKAP